MIDVDRLKEALEWQEKVWPLTPEHLTALFAAARLLVAGQPLWWCEEHDAPGGPRDGGPFDDRCYEWWLNQVIPEAPALTMCRMVEGRWFPLPDKETTDEQEA